jgi:plasmid stability protein
MATLYVENIPDDRYEALRERAKRNRRSIAAEILLLLEQRVPTEEEIRARLDKPRPTGAKFPSTGEMLREDRER